MAPRSPTGEGKLYLASVPDITSRRLLGFALGEHHNAQLTYGVLAMTVAVRSGQVAGAAGGGQRPPPAIGPCDGRNVPGFSAR
jgi:hypothetical protein